MILVSIIYALLGISILIFVHELGHFLAAKKVGVRVERFAIGFDPPIRGRNLRLFSFRRGETEYVLGAVPFGGYVKLAGGEMMLDPAHKPAFDELPGKSVGARALVFVAGSVMNVLFAFIFFMVAFTIGVPFVEPEIGSVQPGSPAWKAGLLPSDRVVAIDGEDVMDFSEIKLAVALGSASKSIGLKVARPMPGGPSSEMTVSVTPRWEPEQGFNVIGVRPNLSNIVAKDAPPGTIAGRAGVLKGDKIVGLRIGGRRVPAAQFATLTVALDSFRQIRPGMPFQLIVSRNGQELGLDFQPRKDEARKPLALLGIESGATNGSFVRDVHSASGASKILRPRDKVIAIQGEPISVVHWLDLVERWGDVKSLSMTILDEAGKTRTESAPLDDLVDWILRGDIQWDEPRARVGTIESDSPLARAGLQAGDLVTHLDEKPVYAPEDRVEFLSQGVQATTTMRLWRAGAAVMVTVPRTDLLEARGVVWDPMPTIRGVVQGGPAAAAGIAPGSRITRLDDRRVFAWQDLREELEKKSPGANLDISWLTATGEERRATVAVKLEPFESFEGSLELNQLERIVKVSPLDSFSAGAKRTLLSAEQIFLTLRSLVRRDVSPKNLSGPLGITHLLTVVAEQDSWGRLIYFLALISINLGLFNLMPFPILDGGHLLFLAIEKVKGSPVNSKVQEWAMNLAFLAIIFLALFVTFNDLKRMLP